MRFKLWRIALILIASQCAAGAAAVIVLQSSWRSQLDHASSVAALAASRLRTQPLVPNNTYLAGLLDEIRRISGARFAAVLDERDQVVVASGLPGDSLRAVKLDPGRPRALETPLRAQLSPLHLVTMEVSLPPTAGEPRYFLLGLPDSAALRSVRDGLMASALAAAATLTIPLLVAHGRFRRWTRGLHELHTAIRRLALDYPSEPVPVGGDDEIAYLSIAFNDMASKLAANRRALLAANAQLEDRVQERTRELDEANHMLQRQNAKLAEVTETALRFTDDVAHEFRTPLTVISECASATAEGLAGAVTDGQIEMLGFVMSASSELSDLVDDFLDSSKLRAGTLRINRRACPAAEVLDKVWPMLARKATAAGVRLERSVTPDLPAVFADLEKAGRALVNLVVNAIKFSHEGEAVTIAVAPTDDGAVRFSVTDRGPGMSAEDASSLFARFQQTATGRQCDAKGFGLGLSIVHDLVAVNLGQITVESELGKGSLFAFTLPVNDPEAIIAAALRRIAQASPDTTIGALRVLPGPHSPAEVLRRLSRTSRAFDVQLPLPGSQRILVFGPTSNVTRWKGRLEGDLQRHIAGNGFPDAAVDELGAWHIDQAREPLSALCSIPAPLVSAPQLHHALEGQRS